MELGMIGLGRMGANMSERLLRGGHPVVGYDPNPKAVQRLVDHGGAQADSLESLVEQLQSPRAIWMMVPSGDPVDQTIQTLLPQLAPQDTLIDGGNSNYKDTLRRYAELKEAGLNLVDCGTSWRGVGLARGLQHDGGWRYARGRTVALTVRNAGTDRRRGPVPRGRVRRGALHQDGSQRDRVQDDAGLCRGICHPGEKEGVCAPAIQRPTTTSCWRAMRNQFGGHAIKHEASLETQYNLPGNRVFYLPPTAFPDTIAGLGKAGLNR